MAILADTDNPSWIPLTSILIGGLLMPRHRDPGMAIRILEPNPSFYLLFAARGGYKTKNPIFFSSFDLIVQPVRLPVSNIYK